jgi:hypothetical protein
MLIRPSISRAQFDPNCYHPIVGKPGEVDTVYGSLNEQELTNSLNLGPAPGESYGHVMMYGLPQNIPFVSTVATGPGFDLHKLKGTINTKLHLVQSYRLGHFHNSSVVDILVGAALDYVPPRIYWADDNGEYDSSRYTDLMVPERDSGHIQYLLVSPYCSHISQDSVEDIVFGIGRVLRGKTPEFDSDYFVYFEGGAKLFSQGKSAIRDSEVFYQTYDVKAGEPRTLFEGDWRGSGRKDLIGGDYYGNLFHYTNDPPFSLARFAHAMLYDTLWAAWQNPSVLIGDNLDHWNTVRAISTSALPKQDGDRSQDFLIGLLTASKMTPTYIFRGSTLSSPRITIDSAALLMYPPERYNPQYAGWYFDQEVLSCGDMTGTGRNVLLSQYRSDDGYYRSIQFYVLGEGIDDHADIEYTVDHFAGYGRLTIDTLTADGDDLTDVIIGMPNYETIDDMDHGKTGVGTIQVVHGSKRIPVHAGVTATAKPTATRFDVYPNPARNTILLSYLNANPATTTVEIRNLLGQSIFKKELTKSVGNQSLRINVEMLPTGTYQVELQNGANRITSRFIKVE